MGAVATQPLPDSIDRYEVLGRLAMGGMAEILLARLRGPSGFERPVVIKRILPHYAEIRAFVEMFLDEARIVARIAHPNVVHVHELQRTENDLYLVMEYLEGESVAGLMRRLTARALVLPPALAAHVCAQACAGLHAAHELRAPDGTPQELVHRDVSPQNLVVTYDGVVKILDFGIAKAADRIAKTEAGVLKGKFEYMSPEQADGLPLDRRSDIFALGTVLYEMSTGHRLFKRETTTMTLRAVSQAIVPAPSQIVAGYPPALEAIVMRALRLHPDDRYPNAAEMRRDLIVALQKLGAEPLPEESLSAFMYELFPDRIEEKRRMLDVVRAGSTLTRLPEAEADPEIELPLAESVVAARTVPDAAPEGRGRRWPILVGGAVLVAVGVVVGAMLSGEDPARAPVTAPTAQPDPAPPPPIAAPSLPPAPEIAAPAPVTLRIDTSPDGAQVLVDGRSSGTTPAVIELPRSEEPIVLTLRREGYRDEARTIVPRESQALELDLTPVPRRGRTRKTVSAMRSFRRFD